MNLEIREFENAIINFCNASTLPIEVKKLVIANIFEQLEQEADRTINIEIAERNRKELEVQNKGIIKVNSNGEVVDEDEQGISEPDKLGELTE